MILFTILGWVLVNLATWLYFEYLGNWLNHYLKAQKKKKLGIDGQRTEQA